MKKVIEIFLAAVLLLSMTACQTDNPGPANKDPDESSVQTSQTHSDYEGIEVQIANAAWGENGFVLEVDWINRTSYEGIFGAFYIIEKREAEEWVSCAIVDDLVFDAVAYVLSPGQTREETYQVSQIFDVSKAGTYRFRSEMSVNNGTENASKCSVWAEFTLNEDAYIVSGKEHTHHTVSEPQTVADPMSGYCGNTQTTVYIDGEGYTFMYDHSVALTDILVNLEYDPNKICRCIPEYTVDTEFGKGYGINLTAGYARCEKGQADLTEGQIDQIRAIIEWVKTEKPGR